MKIALISLSGEGAAIARRLAGGFRGARVFLHRNAGPAPRAERFTSIAQLTRKIFGRYEGLVYIAPCGVAIRAIAANIKHKKTDPAVVVTDAAGRHAVSLLSGHEGGANDLAIAVANLIGAEPVVTTTTEALKTVIVGVGCRRATPSSRIVGAVMQALKEAAVELSEVRLLASADIKSREGGLLRAARTLGLPLRFIPSADIRSARIVFGRSDFVQRKVNLPAVAEPAALLAGRRAQLLLPRKVFNGVTVALARENCSLLE